MGDTPVCLLGGGVYIQATERISTNTLLNFNFPSNCYPPPQTHKPLYSNSYLAISFKTKVDKLL
jgi:hypothetical protein